MIINKNNLLLVCNNCSGADLYNELNQQFLTPFIYTYIDPSEFILLIKNFNNINFNNIKIQYALKQTGLNANKKFFVLQLDNMINIWFFHHKYDKNALTPRKEKHAIYYNKIEQYITEKWLTRVKRMQTFINKNIPVFFMFHALSNISSQDDIINFCSENTSLNLKCIFAESNLYNYVYNCNFAIKTNNTMTITKSVR